MDIAFADALGVWYTRVPVDVYNAKEMIENTA